MPGERLDSWVLVSPGDVASWQERRKTIEGENARLHEILRGCYEQHRNLRLQKDALEREKGALQRELGGKQMQLTVAVMRIAELEAQLRAGISL